eukprot:TRINITY_DN2714_c0_g1_i2.p1 TRINITY_DN2714_c0_g1~~TRINITY_DN2714_c0_g1_i2.p1  ORF type:complete len:153 (+),score=18.75 TRINITY_DN2714_c0_g1_i2:64-522(+)
MVLPVLLVDKQWTCGQTLCVVKLFSLRCCHRPPHGGWQVSLFHRLYVYSRNVFYFTNRSLLSFLLFLFHYCLSELLERRMNPVSGIGKLSQIIFGVISPGNVVGNIIAGAIAEAGAMQAGDIMQTFKTGYLLKTSPRAQYFGTLIGTSISIF